MHAPAQATLTATPLRRGTALACLLAALLAAPHLHARELPYPPGSTPHFHHLSGDDGLAASDVHAVAQDPAGFMWIASDGGLQRYDGYHFVSYTHDPRDPASLAENIVTALAFAPDGSLWIGTQDAGLDRLAPGATGFTHQLHDADKADSLGNDQVFALLLDRHGRLWIGTDQGLDRMDAAGTGYHHYATRSAQPNGERILSLYEENDGRIWVGTDHGVFYYDVQKDMLVRLAPSGGTGAARAALADAPVNAFCRSRDGLLWIGTEHGLAALSDDDVLRGFYLGKTGDEDALQSEHVRGIMEATGGGMWIITLHGGLSRLDETSGRFTTYRHDPTDVASLADDDLRALYRDRTGLLWIASYTSGIDIYNPRTRSFGYYRAHPGSTGLASDIVWSAYEDRAGDLWVGSIKGLTRLDPERRHYTQYDLKDRPASAQDDRVVNAVYGDSQGTLWVGTDYSLARYLPARDAFEMHSLVGAHGDPYETSVNVLFEDSAHRLWVGTQNGLVLFDRRSDSVQRRFLPDARRGDSLPSGLVTDLCETRDGDLWVATSNGLARFDGRQGKFRIYSEAADPRYSLGSANILACLADKDGGLWVGTDDGLDKLDTASGLVRHYGIADGLPDANVLSMLQDKHGDLWIATGKGLSRLSPGSGDFRNYGVADGSQKGSFNSGAAYAAADGEFFFGGEHGLSSFYPEALSITSRAPDVAITRFTALGSPVPLPAGGQPAVIAYRQNILAFDFAAFDYAAPYANRFRYTLEGFEDGWHVIGGGRSVTYTNLDPGHYVLRVVASKDGVSWSDQEARLAIRVLPPPWRSGWAYLGYILALLLGGGAILYLFGRSIRRRQAFLDERNRRHWAEALHQLIQSVTALEDETAIAACLLDSMKSFIQYDRALFYLERGDGLQLIGCRGGDAVEQIYHEQWPKAHLELVERLRHDPAPRLLSPAEAATLESGGRPPRHYLAVPLISGNSGFRLLLVGRSSKTIQSQGVDIAAAMAKQVSVALDKARLIKDLENLATTDGLTRLYNRRTFLQRAESEFERSRRYGRPLSVLMLDVDHFKMVNDNHGHEVGDRVLRVLADEFRRNLRQQDVLGRYGGEEFVAYLPETFPGVAQEVAERLRKSIESLRVPVERDSIRITLSIGIATLRPHDRDISALIISADQALYEAKQQGRNRVVVAA
ncbi:MAG TPA: two-component regulator propeller domain-containing protein [Gammaproteobacteria bacterium]|jgi:diguanylate cyclase (GGDEF)-like protein|nr:two-component regulator propeller domain-containing protein [Gammaproteobacteria bacterium]